MADVQTDRWHVIGASVVGSSHERAGQRCQDAIRHTGKPEPGLPAIAAVADGHGSAKCFRSHLGADFAVVAALEVVTEFARGEWSGVSLALLIRTAGQRLPEELARRWLEAVRRHIDQNPLTVEELDLLLAKEGAKARAAVEANPTLAYGSTLLVAFATARVIGFLQLGDGDILAVSADGEVQRPLARDERLIANETTSLSSARAWGEFRTAFQPVSPASPALIVLSTDGYANSFRDEAGFLKVGSDLLAIIRSDGLDSVALSLESWLQEASAAGSGDDVTLAAMCRTNAVAHSLGAMAVPSAPTIATQTPSPPTEAALDVTGVQQRSMSPPDRERPPEPQ